MQEFGRQLATLLRPGAAAWSRGLAAAWLDVTITPLPEAPGAASHGLGADGAAGEGAAGAGDEPRAVRLTGDGDRWAAAAGSVRLTLSGVPDAL